MYRLGIGDIHLIYEIEMNIQVQDLDTNMLKQMEISTNLKN